MKKIILLLVFIQFTSFAFQINLRHFFDLTERRVINNDTLEFIYIYSDYPNYKSVGASGEGITCVDDVARAIVLLCRVYKDSKDEELLNHIIYMLNFLRYMQTDDGEFYNFVYEDFSINKTGNTSIKSFGFWSARAIWAIGEAYDALPEQYYGKLDSLFYRSISQIDTLISNYPHKISINNKDYPLWLVNKYAADATSELVLGLTFIYKNKQDNKIKDYIEKFVEGLFLMSDTTKEGYIFFLPYPQNIWHAWGNGQFYAIAQASLFLYRMDWINRLMNYADFYKYWAIKGFPAFYDREKKEWIDFPQIAYNIRNVANGFYILKRYIIDGDVWTGIVLSWFFGNNKANQIMYNENTGIIYDGIDGNNKYNKNSGAESTIEGLMSLLILKDRNVRYFSNCKLYSYYENKYFFKFSDNDLRYVELKGNKFDFFKRLDNKSNVPGIEHQ